MRRSLPRSDHLFYFPLTLIPGFRDDEEEGDGKYQRYDGI